MTTANDEPGRKCSIRLITASQYPSTVDVEAEAQRAAERALQARPRARKLKLYGPDMSNAFLPAFVTDVIGLARGREQAPYVVAAPTKAAAVRHLEAAGIRAESRYLRVRDGVEHALTALLDAGLLAADGDIVAWTDRGGVETVRGIATVHPGQEARLWGQWQLARYILGDASPIRYVTFAVRHADGARFPKRTRTGQEPTPITGWVRPDDWTERDAR